MSNDVKESEQLLFAYKEQLISEKQKEYERKYANYPTSILKAKEKRYELSLKYYDFVKRHAQPRLMDSKFDSFKTSVASIVGVLASIVLVTTGALAIVQNPVSASLIESMATACKTSTDVMSKALGGAMTGFGIGLAGTSVLASKTFCKLAYNRADKKLIENEAKYNAISRVLMDKGAEF